MCRDSMVMAALEALYANVSWETGGSIPLMEPMLMTAEGRCAEAPRCSRGKNACAIPKAAVTFTSSTFLNMAMSASPIGAA